MTREIVGVGFGETGPAHDAGVVDQNVDASEFSDRAIDDRARAGLGRDVVGVRDATDLRGDLCRDVGVATGSVHRAAEVVDDDIGSSFREQDRVRAANAAPRAGDDRDASVEAVLVQAVTATGSKPSNRPSVPPSMAARSSAGTPANCRSISSRLPRNVPSAWG
jgi:hypothetical protein